MAFFNLQDINVSYDKKNKDFFVTCEHIFRISVCQSSETMI